MLTRRDVLLSCHTRRRPDSLAALFPANHLQRQEIAEYISSVATTANRMLQSEFEVHRSADPANAAELRLRQRAWVKLSSTGPFADFVNRANELDALEAIAEARLHAKHPETFTYTCVRSLSGLELTDPPDSKSSDPEMTVSALTIPLLEHEISEMRTARVQVHAAPLRR